MIKIHNNGDRRHFQFIVTQSLRTRSIIKMDDGRKGKTSMETDSSSSSEGNAIVAASKLVEVRKPEKGDKTVVNNNCDSVNSPSSDVSQTFSYPNDVQYGILAAKKIEKRGILSKLSRTVIRGVSGMQGDDVEEETFLDLRLVRFFLF